MQTPEWITTDKIKVTLDARPLLAAGEHPLERVKNGAEELNPGEIFELLTPFVPTPMIDKMEALGFDTYSGRDENGLFHTYFLKQ